MKETLDIIEAYERGRDQDGVPVQASVVQVQGSTYRRPGARALFMPDDQIIGLIGGDCLEADLMLQAQEVRELGQPKLITYCAGYLQNYLKPLASRRLRRCCLTVIFCWTERFAYVEPADISGDNLTHA